MKNLLRQAKEIHERNQRRLSEATTEASAADGRITALMNGHRTLLALHIDPELVRAENRELIEQQVIAVVNAVTLQMDDIRRDRFGIISKLPSLTGPDIFKNIS